MNGKERTEGRSERITIRLTPTSRERVGDVAKKLDTTENEALRLIIDDFVGVSDQEAHRSSERIRFLARQLDYNQRNIQALNDQVKDMAQEYASLSAIAKTYSDGKNLALKTVEAGFQRE